MYMYVRVHIYIYIHISIADAFVIALILEFHGWGTFRKYAFLAIYWRPA